MLYLEAADKIEELEAEIRRLNKDINEYVLAVALMQSRNV